MFSAIAQVPGSTIKVVVTDPFGGVYEKTIVREIPSNLPAQWVFTKGVNVDEFVVDNKMPSATGKGYISYISNCDPALDVNNKIARANTAGEPLYHGRMAGRLVAVHHSEIDHKGRNGHQRQVPRTRIRNLIRLRCMANWQASGKGALAAPNGGTHRISVQNNINPTISIVQ